MARLNPIPSSHSTSNATITLGSALDQWYAYLRGSDRIGSPRTITAYQYGVSKLLTRLSGDHPLMSVSQEDIEGLLAELKAQGMSPAGRMAVFRPLSTFFGWCVKRGLLHNSPAADIERPKVKAPDIQYVTDDEWAAVLATCRSRSKHDYLARRDRAILVLLATTGLRVSECAALTLADVDFVTETVTVKHGKGDKPRLLPLLPDARRALDAYVNHGQGRLRSPFAFTPHLWLSSKGAMTASGIAQMCAERGKAAGLTRRLHPHELRHRFIAGAMAQGMPGPLVMALSGHSTPAMLIRYGAHTRQRDAMDMLRRFAEGKAS